MTEGEKPGIQPVSYRTLAERKIWIKPRKRKLADRVPGADAMRWSQAERRLFMITALGGLAGNLVAVLIIGLAIAWVKSPNSLVVKVTALVLVGLYMVTAFLYVLGPGRGLWRRLDTDLSWRAGAVAMIKATVMALATTGALLACFYLLAALGHAAGIK